MNPEIVQAWCNLANAYLQKGDIEKSIETNKKMLKLAPDFALGYNNLANAYYMKEQFDEAIQNCEKASELGFEVHPEFLKLLEPHRAKAKKLSAKKLKTKQSVTKSKTKKTGKAKKSG